MKVENHAVTITWFRENGILMKSHGIRDKLFWVCWMLYEITKSPQALAAARKAGDWWIGLEIKDNPALKGMVGATHGDDIGNDKIVFCNRY